MLGEALKINTSLVTLNLWSRIQHTSMNAYWNYLLFFFKDNVIGNDGVSKIYEGLKKNSSLTILNLGSDRKNWNTSSRMRKNIISIWTGNGIGDEGSKVIADLLQVSSSLTSLNLSREKHTQ